MKFISISRGALPSAKFAIYCGVLYFAGWSGVFASECSTMADQPLTEDCTRGLSGQGSLAEQSRKQLEMQVQPPHVFRSETHDLTWKTDRNSNLESNKNSSCKKDLIDTTRCEIRWPVK